MYIGSKRGIISQFERYSLLSLIHIWSDPGEMNHLQDIVNKNPGRIHLVCHGKAQIPRTAPKWKKAAGI